MTVSLYAAVLSSKVLPYKLNYMENRLLLLNLTELHLCGGQARIDEGAGKGRLQGPLLCVRGEGQVGVRLPAPSPAPHQDVCRAPQNSLGPHTASRAFSADGESIFKPKQE